MLIFPRPPSLVCDADGAACCWWCDGITSLSDTHALGLAGTTMLATTDSGVTWNKLPGWTNETSEFGGIHSSMESFHNSGPPPAFISPSGKNINVTGTISPYTTKFFLNQGQFARALTGPFQIAGLPHLSRFRVGQGASVLQLHDGNLLATAVTTGIGTRPGLLSVVALISRDGGYNFTYTGVVASIDEVPYAHEGPSENALAHLSNGSILCIMRVEGESGHHSPYVSKVSDDLGRSWKHLRSLRTWPGEPIAPGCVRPRLIALGHSLVLAGGRPSPISHDILLWLNAEGDGEAWRPYSVSYQHNRLLTNQSWRIPSQAVNRTRWPRYDTSYVSLLKSGISSGYVVYGTAAFAFALQMRLAPSA